MKLWKRFAATMLTVAMAATTVGCGQTTSNPGTSDSGSKNAESAGNQETGSQAVEFEEKLSWLNTSGTLPIVEEGTEKTLSMAIMMSEDSGEPEEQWLYQFIEEHMNINLEVTKFTGNNKSEFISMAFADDDLPDIIIGASFSTADLMTYGAYEGQLMDLAPYITEELTPNLCAIYEEHPEYKEVVTDNDGHVWSLGYINNIADRGQIPRAFINYDWIEEAGLDVPETTDELLTVLRAFKERGDDIVPMGGTANSNSPLVYVLNAFGYNTTNSRGEGICLRDGKVVLPVADREAYGAYLEYMNTLYTEGLIHPDFFTMDSTTSNAIISEGKAGFVAQAPFVYLSDVSSWWGAKALTSDYNNEAFWPATMSAVSTGGFVVSANCEEPELALAFADWFFTEEHYEMSGSGPSENQTDYLGNVAGFHIDEETKVETFPEFAENPDKYASKNDYVVKEIMLWGFKTFGLGSPSSSLVKQRMAGFENPDDGYADVTSPESDSDLRKTITDGEQHFRLALQDTLCPVVETGYPNSVYLDAETSVEMGNLATVLREYARTESAKFITGARPLSELNDYFDQLEALGALDYVKVYQEYYDAMQ